MGETNNALFIIMWVITFFPCYRMASKAGFGWPMAIVLSIPVIHYISLYFFAFRKWPSPPNALELIAKSPPEWA